MSPFKRLLRRIPPLRWCTYQYALTTRVRQQEARQEYVQSVLATVGNVTIGWAGIERILDELIAFYQHRHTELQQEHPRSLSKKLRYLRVMQGDEINFTAETREFFRYARIEAKRLGDRRHDIIHGLLHLVSARALRWRTQRVVYDKAIARTQNTIYTDADLRALASDISTFGGYLSPKVWIITRGDDRYFAAGELEQARRELGMLMLPSELPKANLER